MFFLDEFTAVLGGSNVRVSRAPQPCGPNAVVVQIDGRALCRPAGWVTCGARADAERLADAILGAAAPNVAGDAEVRDDLTDLIARVARCG